MHTNYYKLFVSSLILFSSLIAEPLTAQTKTNQGKTQQSGKSSSEQLKEDFQNLKDLFKKKEKKDSGQPVPVQAVAGEAKITSGEAVTPPQNLQIATGNGHVLAIKDGVLYGWGDNSEGQLGLGTKSIEYSARQIVPGNDWAMATAAAMHSLAVKKDGSLWAWGWGNSHEMGLGQANSRALVPTRVGTASDWKLVSTSQDNTVAIKKNGTLWVWGSNVSAGLGVGVTPNSAVYVPTQVGRDTTWTDAIAIQHLILAIKKDGSLWSWGRKGYSDARGYEAAADVTTTPTRIGTNNDWVKLYVHRYHGNAAVIAVKQNGELWAWGNNSNGKLGMGDESPRQTPVPHPLKGQWNDFALGRTYSIAVAADGSLWHTGNYLQWTDVKAGEPNSSQRFVKMKLTGKYTGCYLTQTSCVVLTDAEANIYTYGLNARGELGNGVKSGNWVPQKVMLPAPVLTTAGGAQAGAVAATQAPLPTGTSATDKPLTPLAAKLFAKVKSKLNSTEKNAIANLTDFVIAKSNPGQFTVKGQPANEEYPFDIFVYPIDLNNDGKEEVILHWGNTFWSGGAGNSAIVFGKNSAGAIVKLYESQGFVMLMNTKTLGYSDIFIDGPSPTGKYPVCKWNGSAYKIALSINGTDGVYRTLTSAEDASKKYQAGL